MLLKLQVFFSEYSYTNKNYSFEHLVTSCHLSASSKFCTLLNIRCAEINRSNWNQLIQLRTDRLDYISNYNLNRSNLKSQNPYGLDRLLDILKI